MKKNYDNSQIKELQKGAKLLHQELQLHEQSIEAETDNKSSWTVRFEDKDVEFERMKIDKST